MKLVITDKEKKVISAVIPKSYGNWKEADKKVRIINDILKDWYGNEFMYAFNMSGEWLSIRNPERIWRKKSWPVVKIWVDRYFELNCKEKLDDFYKFFLEKKWEEARKNIKEKAKYDFIIKHKEELEKIDCWIRISSCELQFDYHKINLITSEEGEVKNINMKVYSSSGYELYNEVEIQKQLEKLNKFSYVIEEVKKVLVGKNIFA